LTLIYKEFFDKNSFIYIKQIFARSQIQSVYFTKYLNTFIYGSNKYV